MRKIWLLFAFLCAATIINAQTNRKPAVKDAHDRYANTGDEILVTSRLPEGTVFKGGKITVKEGYRTSYTDNKQVIIVQQANGNITGAFTCACKEGQGGCTVSASGSVIICIPVGCGYCEAMLTTVEPTKGVAITKANSNWKKIIIPTAQ